MAMSAVRRHLLDIQGFERVDDETLARNDLWLRFAPAMCGLIAAVGTALASPAMLWSLAVVAAAGAALPFHPFDLPYNVAIRRLVGGPRLPDNQAPRRFACALGTAWLAVTAALFAAGLAVAGSACGAAFVFVAVLVATTHVCIPSILFRIACGQWPALLPRRA